MKYLLDTCVVSDFFQGEEKTVRKIKNTKPIDLCVSVITIAEVEYGILKRKETKKAIAISQIAEQFFSLITIIELDVDIAKKSASIRAELSLEGIPIGGYDLLIAATGHNNRLIMVTSNMSEFSRIKGLELENWRN